MRLIFSLSKLDIFSKKYVEIQRSFRNKTLYMYRDSPDSLSKKCMVILFMVDPLRRGNQKVRQAKGVGLDTFGVIVTQVCY